MEMDILCFSHIPWEKPIQRPQEIMRRFARRNRIIYFEEPIFQQGSPKLLIHEEEHGAIWSVIPSLPNHLSPTKQKDILHQLVEQLIEIYDLRNYLLWFYHPAAVEFTRNLNPGLIIYDCITRLQPNDEKNFALEAELLQNADVIINDSQELCDDQAWYKGSNRLFPGSMDVDHFFAARAAPRERANQSSIPRLGFWGVINHIFNTRLVEAVAKSRPDWHISLLGPISADPGNLLNIKNIHYFGACDYSQLPVYLSGWDVAILPLNWQEDGTGLTAVQVPQYLAGGCPVVSTQIPVVVRSFGWRGLVDSAETPEQFISAVENAITGKRDHPGWLDFVDTHLANCAWDLSWEWMVQSITMAFYRQNRLEPPIGIRVPVMQS